MEKELAELGRIKVEFALEYQYIKNINIIDEANEHSRMTLSLVAKQMLTPKDVLPLEDEPVKVIDSDGDNIFVGISQTVGLANEADYSEIIIEAKSYSSKADRKKISRTFQSTVKKLSEVANEVMDSYGIKVEVKDDLVVNQMLYQNNETDWEFLKRIANQFGSLIFTDSKADNIRIAIGPYPFARKQLGKETTKKIADTEKDILKYIKIKKNVDSEAEPYEFENQIIESYDLTIGTGYMMQAKRNRTCYTIKSEIRTKEETVQNRLTLATEEGCRPESKTSAGKLNQADYIKGKIIRVQGTQIKVHFDCDQNQDESTAMWMPFENTMNNYLYSMPDEGDIVFVYYENNGKAVALGSQRANSQTHQDYIDPSSKMMNSTNKMLKFTPGSTELVANRETYDTNGGSQAMIKMTDEEGVLIISTQDIHIQAEKRINLQASKAEIKTEDIKKEIERYKKDHDEGEKKYIAGGGGPAFNPGGEVLKQLGGNIVKSFADGIKAMATEIPTFVENIQTTFGGNSQANPAPQEPGPKEPERPKQDTLWLVGMENCSLGIGTSEIWLRDGTIEITAEVYRQLGYEKGEHQRIEAPSIMDTLLDGAQVLLDIAGCIPVVSVVANGINAAISLARGDFFGATCSLIGCIIPGAGVAGKSLKVVAAGAKVANKLTKASKAIKAIQLLMTGVIGFNAAMRSIDGITGLYQKYKDGKLDFSDPKTWNLIIDTLGSMAVAVTAGKSMKKEISSKKNGNRGTKGNGDAKGKNKGPDETKVNGKQATKDKECGDPVNVVTGSFTIKITDLVLKDIGEDFVLTRAYESLHENHEQHLGSRWLLNLGSRIERQENRITILMSDLHLETFEKIDGMWNNQRGKDQSMQLMETKEGYVLKFINEMKTYNYNQFGRITAITDRNGNRVTIEYIGTSINKITLANGQELRFEYDKNKLSRIIDMLGRTTEYHYEGELLTKVTYPNNGTIQYEYTKEGWITKITDQNGHSYVHNEYDNQGRVIRQELANGGEMLFFYQPQDRMTTVTTPYNGQRISYIYNRKKLVVKTIYNDQTEEEARHDEKENIIWEKDRRGNETHYKYNEQSQLIEEKLPNGLIHNCIYDQQDRKIEDNDNAGTCIRYTYDEQSNLIEIKSLIDGARWQKIQYKYDAKGRITAYTDENGNTTIYNYNQNQSAPSSIKTPEGDIFDYEYDKAQRTMAIESSLGRKEYAYNNIDYITMEIDALGNTTKYEYDKLCNLIKEIRPNQYDNKQKTGKGWNFIYDALDKLEKKIDPLGNTIATPRDEEENIIKEINPNTYDEKTQDGEGIQNIWDENNRKIKIIYPDGGIERIKYDACGNIIKKIQPINYDQTIDDGKGYIYQYDEMNRLIKITNPEGIVEKSYIYDLKGNIIKEINSQGYQAGIGTLYRYNNLGWLTEKRIPLNNQNEQTKYQVTQYKYDQAGNITEERRIIDQQDEASASGRILSIYFTYDKQNRLIKVSDNTGAVIQYNYNCLNQKTYEKRKINQTTNQIIRYHYDQAGRLIAKEENADREGSGQFTATTKYELDKTGNVIKITTPAGYIITREYDQADRLIQETHIDKQNNIENKTEFTYDKAGNIVEIKDINGTAQKYEYDLLNRVTKHIGKNGGITRTIYDKNGRLIKKILPNEYQAKAEQAQGYQYTYDTLDRIITIIAPNGKIVETNTYDKNGRLQQKLDATKSGVSYEYDLANRTKKIQSIGGASQEYQYDARGNIIGIIDGNNNKTQYNLDNWGRITQITKADETKEYYEYDYAGNITSTTDAQGNKIEYEYNNINKLVQITDQAGQTDYFNYDAQGRIKNHIDRNGNKISYCYNIYDSLTEKIELNAKLTETYQYYQDGTLKAAIAQGMRYSYSYYPDGKLKQKTASGKILLAYEYDLNGNKIKQTDVTSKTTNYNYNITDHLTEITDEQNKIVSFSHNEDGTIKEITNANGIKTIYDYDIDKNIASMNINFNGQTLAQNKYTYDGNGNRTVKEQLRGTTTYTYDSLDRLTKAQYPDYGEELFYDKAGNRTSRIAKGIEEQYTYDVRNRLISHTQNNIQTSYTYDNAGNLLNDGDKTYTYDSFNRNIKVETKDGQVQINKYDAEGLRYEIEENGKLVQFIFNENKEVVVEKKDQNLKRLIRSSDLWASECTQEKTWYHYASDEQGSTIFIADNEEIKNRYEYDAWGNTVVCEEKVENRYKYTGQQYDPITQQYYLRARYYNPVIARFTQEDEYRGDGLNLYAYCDNNPVKYYDPSGYTICEKKYNELKEKRHEQGKDSLTPEERKNYYEHVQNKRENNRLDRLQNKADDAAKSYNTRGEKTPAQRAAEKGFPGIGTTPNGGPTFKDTPYIYPVQEGQKNIVKIKATGDRTQDFKAANEAANISSKPKDATWHHVDDYDVRTGELTLELTQNKAHDAAKTHAGSSMQYDSVHGPSYNPPKKSKIKKN